jgi:hypothetical protein
MPRNIIHTRPIRIERSNVDKSAVDVLDGYRLDAQLSNGELWLRYFELGGMRTGLELEAVLLGFLQPSIHDHDVIAHALNERFTEMGGDHPVPYFGDAE